MFALKTVKKGEGKTLKEIEKYSKWYTAKKKIDVWLPQLDTA